jgi:hypothetical protein
MNGTKAAIPTSHQGRNRRSNRFSQRDESAVRDSAHMPSGRTFLANRAATLTSAVGIFLQLDGRLRASLPDRRDDHLAGN